MSKNIFETTLSVLFLTLIAMGGFEYKWYDGFLLSMYVTNVVIVVFHWNKYNECIYPLHVWIVVDYITVSIFRILMFVDNGLVAGVAVDFERQQQELDSRFCGRVVVLSILVLLLYPFLWVWTVVGTLWFTKAGECLSEDRHWGVFILLLFNASGLACITYVCIRKWLKRRRANLLRAPHQGIPISEFGILVGMVRMPDWAFDVAGEVLLRNMGRNATTYRPGLYSTSAQREAVKVLIQELPKFMLKTVPADCTECSICLEEFDIGNVVRGLPCAHNFHIECIDQWLRLNVKCPRCRSSVFPGIDLSALSNLQSSDAERQISNTQTIMEARSVRSQPPRQSYLLRLQGLLRPIRLENANPRSETADTALETAENGGVRQPN